MQDLSGTTITIPAIPQKVPCPLYVYQGGEKVGLLNLEVYEEKTKEVYIVPIANLSSDPTELIEKVFKEANMNLNIQTLEPWQNDDFTASTTIAMPEEVGLLNKYSDDMRSLRDAYFSAHPNLPKNAYYIFVVAGFNSNDEKGYMVRGKSIGFVKASASPRTFAHELAHGIGALEHTWKNGGPDSTSTTNLMDYSPFGGGAGGGLEYANLTKAQWKKMRSWSSAPSFWDEDGMLGWLVAKQSNNRKH